ncbi:L-rhamnose mutarotase [Olivibacter ginsenosidimutans]|uniref:L-rhamnose mutarotase n=1 Tax=Olivibacter ginsenosidimutans TaxID=1176537 RepID=A0ABP9BUE6_9SPHI
MAAKIAFKMKLLPGFQEEYKKRHDAIWPELCALLKEHGISDYSIFFDEETNGLFAVQRLAEGSTSHLLGQQLVMKKWWTHMADIMETNADDSPVAHPLPMMFHLD